MSKKVGGGRKDKKSNFEAPSAKKGQDSDSDDDDNNASKNSILRTNSGASEYSANPTDFSTVGANTIAKPVNKGGREVWVILDLATLETVNTRKGEVSLLSCDDHIGIMKKAGRDPAELRPDIVHQELMSVLDSPLNKAGRVKILVHTQKNVLFEVSPKTRIPRTYKRFAGLMTQLLHKFKIRSSDGKDMLLRVLKNPIARHLPAGAACYGFSHKGVLQSPVHFASDLPDDKPIVLVFGAMASGSIAIEDHPYFNASSLISISEYPLSGSVAINRVMGAIENHWGII